MKWIIPFTLFFGIFCLVANAQQTPWQWVNPNPQGNPLNAVWAVNQDTAVAVGATGTILRTSNSGLTWQVTSNIDGISDQFFGTQFLNGSLGWVIGEYGDIIKTTDAGESWIIQNSNTGQDLFGLYFISSTTGWIDGLNGIILKTTDGGTTWVQQTSNTTSTLYGVYFTSPSNGVVVGENGTILGTTNGGTTWVPRTSGTNQSLYDVSFISSLIGYTVGSFGAIFRTVDGGTTWTPQISGQQIDLLRVQFISALTGWTIGSYGTILKTTNGGSSWFVQNSNSYNDLFGMRFISSTVGFVVGDLGVMFATTDGGTTWQSQSTSVKDNLNGINFASMTDGWAVGAEGTIIRTANGGLTWQQQTSGVYQDLYGIYMVTPSIGWAVGDSAVIVKTTNAGQNWIEQNSHSDPTLYSIYFVDNATGWAAGDFGTILKTTNGLVWAPQTTPTTATLQKIAFLNSSIGWAIGYNGVILKTTNGGTTWLQQNSNVINSLNGIEIIDASNLYIVGDFGTLLKTTNGGTTWTQIPSDPTTFLYGVVFYSATIGWAVGDDGVIMNTTDGGITWNFQTTPTQNRLWDIELIRSGPSGILFTSGDGGTILCSGITPLSLRTWTGTFDSLWSSAGNWSPPGSPGKLDSIFIPVTSVNPVLRITTQQINLSALRIAPGAALTIGTGISQLVVKSDIVIDGTLNLESGSTLEITTGGSFLVNSSGTFQPAKSSIIMNSAGQVRGPFYNLFIDAGTSVQSLGNITVAKTLTLMSSLNMRNFDTLSILNPQAQAIQGYGFASPGTIIRAIQPNSTDSYRFESPVTYVYFYPTGTLPNSLTMTVKPNSLPSTLAESLFVRRTYNISASGGSNYSSTISLRYDTSETSIPIDNLSLFRDSLGIIKNIGSSDYLDSDFVAISLDTLKAFSSMYIGNENYFPLYPYQFYDTLTVTDRGGISDTLVFGADPNASNGIDSALGEIPLGPIPPAGHFDARWTIPPSQGTQVDLLPLLGSPNTTNVYPMTFQPGPAGYPMTFHWQNSVFPVGMILLEDQATQGAQFTVNMRSQNSFTVTNGSIGAIQIVHRPYTTYSFNQNWNLISQPLSPTFPVRKVNEFPTATSNLFGYSNSYVIADTIKIGKGYWIKFPSAQTIGIEGLPFSTDTVSVTSGWNLIGTISSPIATKNIVQNPSNIIVSNYFGYTGSYQTTDTLRPSKGYWAKSSGIGKLIFSSSGNIPSKSVFSTPSATILQNMNSLKITDREGNTQTLYFTELQNNSVATEQAGLPPLPPDGVFDARFTSDQFIEVLPEKTSQLSVMLQTSAYPVTIQWKITEPSLRSLHFFNQLTNAAVPQNIDGQSGTAKITDPTVKILTLKAERGVAIPTTFALKQNYPNPFNPLTTIEFDVPVRSNVTLKVFDILGQQVAILANNKLYQPGSFSAVFNPSSLASGIYFYQILANEIDGAHSEYREVKKMMLLK